MKRNSFLAVVAAIVCSMGQARAAEFKLPDADATPAELVNAALRSELDGPSDTRKTLLDRALKLDSDYAPARWHSGFVRYDNEWLTLDEVAKRAAGDTKLAEYRKRRDAMIDRAEDHRALAHWCKKNGLVDEARVHWAKVLEFDPADAGALAALGLQLYEGQLLNKQQIVEAKKQAGERMQAMKRWQPQMFKWRKAIETLSGHDYEFALHELRKLNDVEALPALEAMFAHNGTGPKADALNLALIETAGQIQGPEATQVLLRRAIQADSEAMRAAACDELKERPMYTYVPQLIAAIPARLKAKYQFYVANSGVFREQEFVLEGKDSEFYFSSDTLVTPVLAIRLGHPLPTYEEIDRAMVRQQRSILTNELQQVARTEDAVTRYQQSSAELTSRIRFALKRATGSFEGDDADLLERQWNEYNAWYNSPTRFKRRFSNSSAGVFGVATIASHSCFPKGTPVLTALGLRSIESIKQGDQVLSQDVQTGELSYKSVQTATIRSTTSLLGITTDAGTVRTTKGHPFWVVGNGWRVSKFLKPGDRLSTLTGTVSVTSLEELPGSEVYNLVVDNSHNYFVGEQQMLVHDNSPLSETTTVVPGLELTATRPAD